MLYQPYSCPNQFRNARIGTWLFWDYPEASRLSGGIDTGGYTFALFVFHCGCRHVLAFRIVFVLNVEVFSNGDEPIRLQNLISVGNGVKHSRSVMETEVTVRIKPFCLQCCMIERCLFYPWYFCCLIYPQTHMTKQRHIDTDTDDLWICIPCVENAKLFICSWRRNNVPKQPWKILEV